MNLTPKKTLPFCVNASPTKRRDKDERRLRLRGRQDREKNNDDDHARFENVRYTCRWRQPSFVLTVRSGGGRTQTEKEKLLPLALIAAHRDSRHLRVCIRDRRRAFIAARTSGCYVPTRRGKSPHQRRRRLITAPLYLVALSYSYQSRIV